MADHVEKTPESLFDLVFRDDLTSLHNRRYLFKWLRAEVKWAHADAAPVSLLMLDLDDFKKINDEHGHLAGDDAIRHFATSFIALLRPGDVGIRYAGDEFVVILPGTPKDDAAVLGRAILERLEGAPWPPDASKPLFLNASAGLATFPEDAKTPEELVDRADEALLHSKRMGKNVLSIHGQLDRARLAEIRALDGIPCPRYIGRESEIAAMDEAIVSAGSGRGRLVFVEGNHGAGKTRFLGEAIRRSKDLSWTCLLERCSEYESALPLQPLVSLVGQYVRTHPEEGLRISRTISPEDLGVLSENIRVLDAPPDAVARCKSLPEPAKGTRFFQALTGFLRLLAKQRPLLVALDGFQFVDPGTIEALCALVTSEDTPILVAAAGGPAPGGPGARAFDRLRPGLGEALCAVELGPLSDGELRQFLTDLLPGEVDVPKLMAIVAPISRGNPLFVEECLKYLILRGLLRRDVSGWTIGQIGITDLPTTLDEVIWSRLSTLDPETSRIIAGAAVIGPNFALDVLQGLSGRNQGETQELIDRARKARIIAPSSEGEMQFVSSHLQEVTYNHIEPGELRDLHGQVGKIEEDRGANPARLAAHAERAGDGAKMEKFRAAAGETARNRFPGAEGKGDTRRTRLVRKARVKEATHALDRQGVAAATDLLRCLALAVKSRKMYPSGSVVAVSSGRNFLKAATEVLLRTDSVTLSVEKGVLSVNGQAVDAKGLGAVAQEAAVLLEERMIRGITFAREASTESLEQLLALLIEVKPEQSLDPAFWEEALDARGIAHLGVHPRTYVATGDRDTEVSVGAAVGAAVRESLRALSAAVDNARMYPAGSQLISASLEQLQGCLAQALERLAEVTFAEIDGALVVNGIAGTAHSLGTTAASALRLLKERQLKSCSIRRGIGREEIGALVEEFARGGGAAGGAGAALTKRLAERGVTHVEVGEAWYALDRGEESGGRQPAGAPAPPPPPPEAKPEEAVAQVRRWLAGNPADLATEPVSAQVPQAVERIALDGHRGLVKELGTFLMGALAASEEPSRRRVCDVLAACWDRVRPVAPADWIAAVEPRLGAILNAAKSPDLHDSVAAVALPLIEDRAAARDYVAARELLRSLGGGEETGVRARPGLDRHLRLLAEKTVDATLIGNLTSPDRQVRLDSLAYLTGLGRCASLVVAKAIGDSPDLPVRDMLARLLRSWGKEAVDPLRAELSPFQDAARAARVAEVLDLWTLAPAQDLVLALGHRDASVWKSALVAARKVPRREAAEGLARALGGLNPAAAAGAAHALGELRLEEALPQLREALRRWKDPKVLQEVCLALGILRDAASSVELTRIATAKGFLWFSKGPPEEVRAAACWALCEVGAQEAQGVLKRLARDASYAVRSAIHERR